MHFPIQYTNTHGVGGDEGGIASKHKHIHATRHSSSASKCMNAMQLWRSETIPLIVLFAYFLLYRTVLFKVPTGREIVRVVVYVCVQEKEYILYISVNSICDCNTELCPHTHTHNSCMSFCRGIFFKIVQFSFIQNGLFCTCMTND